MEFDYAGICWGADLRYVDGGWIMYAFRSSKWQKISSPFLIEVREFKKLINTSLALSRIRILEPFLLVHLEGVVGNEFTNV